MNTEISITNAQKHQGNLIIISYKESIERAASYLTVTESEILEQSVEKGNRQITFLQKSRLIVVEILSKEENRSKTQELARRTASKTITLLRQYKVTEATLIDSTGNNLSRNFAEGMVLSNYQFLKYLNDKEKTKSTFSTLHIPSGDISEKELTVLKSILEGVCSARDLVNEPLSYLTAPQLSEEIKLLGEEAGFSVNVLEKEEIAALGMGGILSVNQGSLTPPTFSILEWKPAHAKNKQAIVLVGKGVVYDTGGVSLKPTKNSMDFMKCDMAGSATVIGTIYAAAKSNMPLHIICLVPATDNRPGVEAYVPGDIVKMYSGTTVEVLNTDAEGRMLLADALHYAKQYDPELVIDVATLTGSAARAIGTQGGVFMGTAPEMTKKALSNSGYEVHERLVEFPIWDEYKQMLKSDIADLKNLGGSEAGAITAGKFLEHFTDYDWIHIDIAGVAFMHHRDSYRPKGGTGYGVQLLYNFLSNYKDVWS